MDPKRVPGAGLLLLEGGAEFKGRMAEADRAALQAAGGRPVTIVPAAAVPEGGQEQAGRNGVDWFRALGATEVRSTGWVEGESARDPAIARAVRDSNLIFLPGGSPRYLAEALQGSPVWEAIAAAHASGAVVGGSSAGAMVLCGVFYDPVDQRVRAGLGLLPGICILPHYDTFGRTWVHTLHRAAAGVLLVGIDEETGIVNDGPDGRWTVYGKGAVTLHGPDGEAVYRGGKQLALFKL
jgi:cyanophycinase